ncbi:MAG: protein kinase [Thermodesulfobacteriota bacterium]|nr:protein kinase [Thermodesulfobacteriota bacterium]
MKRIGKYEVCGLLGAGGMGKVYKVRMPVVGKIVALKLLAPHPNLVALLGKEEVRTRFLTEALTMARLRHPHIVAIWDFHDEEDLTFFVMEYFCNNLGVIIGETYRVEAPSRVLSVDKTLHYTRQILEGLCRLHQAGIIHRDIKPFNILVTDQDQVKITDFGLSKLHGEVFRGPDNLMVGSPYYAAPEQEEDPNNVDVRADLYPAGVMVYRMLTGELPLDSFKRVSAFNPDLDPAWDTFLLRAMAEDRESRFPSAKKMLEAFDALQGTWEKKKEKACLMPDLGLEKGAPPIASNQTLRRESLKIRPSEAREVFGADSRWRPVQYVTNDFLVERTGAVTDKATGLVWQQGGSDYPVTWHEAHDYIESLNQKGFAGRTGWRLPTVNELMSLLTQVPKAGDLCVAPVFHDHERWLWSADRRSFTAAWYVSADMGYISWQDFSCYYYVRAVCSLRQ